MKKRALITSVVLLALLGTIALRGLPTSQPSSTQPLATTGPSADAQYKTIKGEAGFWRLAMTYDGVWWFISPDGNREFLNAVTTVQPFQLGRDKDGPDFISRDWNAPRGEQGDIDAWAKNTLARVHDYGFKSLGAWCHPVFQKYEIPSTRDLNLTPWRVSANLRLYSTGWPALAERAVQQQVEGLKDNHNIVGYYTDNELEWGDAVVGPGAYFDDLPVDDPNRQEVVRVIHGVWPNLADFNKDWNVKLAGWEGLSTWKVLPRENDGAYSRLFSAWLSHYAQDYFRTATALVHKYDPNHLILGVRFRGQAPAEVVRASHDYTDAQSINFYPDDALLDQQTFDRLHDLSGQPVVISEFSFHALDGRSGNRNTVGFGAQVPDQQARADGYHLFTTRAARVPYIVGADWFQWMDEPPAGRVNDGEDVNFGIVDVDDKPYDALVESVKKTTPQLNPLHLASSSDDQKDVWRESFASKPTMNVPYLAIAPTINGELNDWPGNSRVPAIRRAQIVGLDRSPLPLPIIQLGWRPEGLYVGIEVFDNDIQGANPLGWWWARDSVEFWLSTRPVTADQESYNPFCHQFFFVPTDSPVDGRYNGCVGQWHRDGDAIHDNIVPHPDIRQATRIFPDRYVVEMLIPAKVLNGWDPQHYPNMAFNFHVRNYQHALSYYWSAPKEVITQLRPSTWGSLTMTGGPAVSAVPSTMPAVSVR